MASDSTNINQFEKNLEHQLKNVEAAKEKLYISRTFCNMNNINVLEESYNCEDNSYQQRKLSDDSQSAVQLRHMKRVSNISLCSTYTDSTMDESGMHCSLTQEGLESYNMQTASRNGPASINHQKQSSYAQSEGYHSYVSSSDSSSTTPFLDRLRQESSLLSRQSLNWSQYENPTVFFESKTPSPSLSVSNVGRRSNDMNKIIYQKSNNDDCKTNSVNNCFKRPSSTETLKCLGSLGSMSEAVNRSDLDTSTSKLVAHSSHILSPQRHQSESVLFVNTNVNSKNPKEKFKDTKLTSSPTAKHASLEILNNNYTTTASTPIRTSLPLPPKNITLQSNALQQNSENALPIKQANPYISSFTVGSSICTNVQNEQCYTSEYVRFKKPQYSVSLHKSKAISPKNSDVDNNRTLSREKLPTAANSALNGGKSNLQFVSGADLKAFQKNAVQSYVQRQQQNQQNYKQTADSVYTGCNILPPTTTRQSFHENSDDSCLKHKYQHSKSVIQNSTLYDWNLEFDKNQRYSPEPPLPPPRSHTLANSLLRRSSSASDYAKFKNMQRTKPKDSFDNNVEISPPPPPPRNSFSKCLAQPSLCYDSYSKLVNQNVASGENRIDSNKQIMEQNCRSSGSQHYTSTASESEFSNSWVPERPPKNPNLRIPSPELPPPPPEVNETKFSDEPLPPPPPEILYRKSFHTDVSSNNNKTDASAKINIPNRRNSFAGSSKNRSNDRRMKVPPPPIPKKPSNIIQHQATKMENVFKANEMPSYHQYRLSISSSINENQLCNFSEVSTQSPHMPIIQKIAVSTENSICENVRQLKPQSTSYYNIQASNKTTAEDEKYKFDEKLKSETTVLSILSLENIKSSRDIMPDLLPSDVKHNTKFSDGKLTETSSDVVNFISHTCIEIDDTAKTRNVLENENYPKQADRMLCSLKKDNLNKSYSPNSNMARNDFMHTQKVASNVCKEIQKKEKTQMHGDSSEAVVRDPKKIVGKDVLKDNIEKITQLQSQLMHLNAADNKYLFNLKRSSASFDNLNNRLSSNNSSVFGKQHNQEKTTLLKQADNEQLLQRSEITFQINVKDAASQTDDNLEQDMGSYVTISHCNEETTTQHFIEPRQRHPIEVDCDLMSKELACLISSNEKLTKVLNAQGTKAPADYINDFFHPYVHCKANKRDVGTTTLIRMKSLRIHDKTSITESADAVLFESTETSNESLKKRKINELIEYVSQKIAILRTEQKRIKDQSEINSALGKNFLKKLSARVRPIEATRFRTYIEDVGSITSLLLSLAERLARLENYYVTVSKNTAEKNSLDIKRNHLLEQLVEAKRLKDDITRRSSNVTECLERHLSSVENAEFEFFINTKTKLIADARDIDDKINIAEEQFSALQDALLRHEF